MVLLIFQLVSEITRLDQCLIIILYVNTTGVLFDSWLTCLLCLYRKTNVFYVKYLYKI